MSTVNVALGDRSYPIVVEPGSLAHVGKLAAGQLSPSRALVISNPKIAERYSKSIISSLETSGISASLALVPPGERYKSLRTAERLINEAIAQRLDRSSVIIALGGGVVGDLAGFVAAIYLRGVPFIQVPTSLLAQVDASVGGKTAVNHPAGKNLVGSFHQPRLVVIDPTVLQSLPIREMRSGLAEMVKHGMILEADYFALLEREMAALLRCETDALTEAVIGSCRLKANIVAADERESGARALLNYGHTFGHALEAVTSFRRYKHGEAVSLGMEMAAQLAVDLGRLGKVDAARQTALLRAAGLPTVLRGRIPFEADDLLAAMQLDKKVAHGRVRFVLAERVGAGSVVPEGPGEAVRSVCERFISDASVAVA